MSGAIDQCSYGPSASTNSRAESNLATSMSSRPGSERIDSCRSRMTGAAAPASSSAALGDEPTRDSTGGSVAADEPSSASLESSNEYASSSSCSSSPSVDESDLTGAGADGSGMGRPSDLRFSSSAADMLPAMAAAAGSARVGRAKAAARPGLTIGIRPATRERLRARSRAG